MLKLKVKFLSLYNGDYYYYIDSYVDSMTGLPVRKFSGTLAGATKFDSASKAKLECSKFSDSSFKVLGYCPLCKKEFEGHPAISRFDNKTEICLDCGIKEALQEFMKHTKK